MNRRRWAWTAAMTVTVIGSAASAAPAKKPTAGKKPAAKSAAPAKNALRPEMIITRLARDEAKVTSGRISLAGTQRVLELDPETKPAAVAAQVAKAPLVSQRREYLIFTGGNWKRDLTVMDPSGDVGQHLLIGVNGKVGRMLQEVKQGAGGQRRSASIGPEPEQTAADRLLLMRGADILTGIDWSTAVAAGPLVTLTGTSNGDRATAVIRTAPRYAIEKMTIFGKSETPQGPITRSQEIKIAYATGKSGLELKSIEHLIYYIGPVNRAVLTQYKIEGSQLNSNVPSSELEIEIPQGTSVTDGRIDPPVRYKQAEKVPTLAELKSLQEKQGMRQAALNLPVPEFELMTLDEKAFKLSELKGKVVLLTWFASWCGPCHAEAPEMEREIWQKYRARGLVVFGVNAGERQDPHEMARGFVKQHTLTYPVLMDVDSEAVDLFRIEAFPTIALIDRKGVLRYVRAGFNKPTVIEQIEKLLEGEP